MSETREILSPSLYLLKTSDGLYGTTVWDNSWYNIA